VPQGRRRALHAALEGHDRAHDLRGERVLIAAHGNSLRALVKHLDNISDADIVELNIPTGVPLVYELSGELRPLSKRYLGDPVTVRAAAEAVAKQGPRLAARGAGRLASTTGRPWHRLGPEGLIGRATPRRELAPLRRRRGTPSEMIHAPP
jgi:hypothetical protein